MEDNRDNRDNQPLDIPDAAAPSEVSVPRPAAPRAKGTRKKAPAGKKGGGKRAVKPGAGTRKAEDDLPVWLGKLVDWVMDVPAKLRRLPKAFKRLWRSWFYRVYFPLVLIALIGIFIGCRWLNGFAADYEAAQPIHVADQVGALFKSGDYGAIFPLDTSAQEISGGDPAFYTQSLQEVSAGGEIAWDTAFSSDKDELKYNVTLNGSKFATFTLVPSGQTSPHGNRLWQLGSVTTHVVTEQAVARQDPNNAPYRIQALPEYTVTVDGVTLTASEVTRTGIPLYPDGFLPSDVAAPTLTEYGFFGESFPPEITVTAPDGSPVTPQEDSQNIWVCGLQEDAAMKAQYEESIVKMAQRIAKYTTADVSRSTALDAVLSGSPAEEVLKKFNNGWAPSHKEESFENMAVTDFCVLSDTCLTCHVKFDYILTSKRENDYTYPTEYTFCIVRRNGEGKLYNVVFH